MKRGGQPYDAGYVGDHFREKGRKMARKRGKVMERENPRAKTKEKGEENGTSCRPRIAMAQ